MGQARNFGILGMALTLALLLLAACSSPGSNGGGSTNGTPTAVAQAPDTATVGERVQLDASASSDPDGDALSFAWTLSDRPDGSTATIEDATSAEAFLTPDVPGAYEVRVAVSDGRREDEATTRIDVTAGGSPIANAGEDQRVAVGSTVNLQGVASGVTGEAAYAWTLQAPDGSSATLTSRDTRATQFTPDVGGTYRATFEVTVGADVHRDTVTVTANRAPTADAGSNQTVTLGQAVILNGQTSDPDGDALTSTWRFVTRPSGSTAQISNPTSRIASFQPDVTGTYVTELSVDDGLAQDTDRTAITVQAVGGGDPFELYVAPTGNDANAGTAAAPLRTVGEAVRRANANASIGRIRLAAGSYAIAETVEVTAALQITGPTSGAPATLAGGTGVDPVVEPASGAALTLANLTVTGDEYGVEVPDGASLDFVSSTCSANVCIRVDGGEARISNATLEGPGVSGVGLLGGARTTIVDTTIENFSDGVTVLASPLTMRGGTVRGNETGVETLGTSETIDVQDTTFDGNGTGLAFTFTTDVTLTGIEVANSTGDGIVAERGSVLQLTNVTVRNGDGSGLVLGESAGSGASDGATLRNVSIRDNASHGIHVLSRGATLDLGRVDVNGGNELTGNGELSLLDARVTGATGSITSRGTTFFSAAYQQPSARTYEGPVEVERRHQTLWVFRTVFEIVGDGNEVTIYPE